MEKIGINYTKKNTLQMVIQMKKMILFFSFLILTGCGTKEKELHLEELKTKLEEITVDALDYENLIDSIDEPLDAIKIYDKEEISDILGLEETMYQNIFFCESNEEIDTYLIIEPNLEQKDVLEKIINQYWDRKIEATENEEDKNIYQNRLEQSYGENLIYLVGKKTTEELDKIKDNKKYLFSNMLELEKTDLEEEIKLNIENIDSYLFVVSDKLNRVEQYIILKCKKDEVASIQKSMHDYFETLEYEWINKDTKNYQLLKNRMEEQLGNYLIYLVSEENEKAYQIIEESYE